MSGVFHFGFYRSVGPEECQDNGGTVALSDVAAGAMRGAGNERIGLWWANEKS